MQRTKLYTLNTEEVLSDNLHSLQMWEASYTGVPGSDKAIVTTVNTKDIPVHHFREIKHGEHKDHFFAIAPELLAMLAEATRIELDKQLKACMKDLDKNKELLSKAEYNLENSKFDLNVCKSVIQELQRSADEFRNKPWYKRVWLALFNKV